MNQESDQLDENSDDDVSLDSDSAKAHGRTESKSEGESDTQSDVSQDADGISEEGPGWMPAIIAGTLILGMVIFIGCSVATWLLFGKRTEYALRTLNENYIPVVEQSFIGPEEKNATLKLLNELAKDMERGKYENWQSGGVMTRLARLPVFYWGDLAALEAFVEKHPSDFADDSTLQMSRLRRAVEMDEATRFDFEYVLEPVLVTDDSLRGRRLRDPYSMEQVRRVIGRCREIADRFNVKDRHYKKVWIDKIVRKQIEVGLTDGTK